MDYYKMDNPSQLTLEVTHAGGNTDPYSSCRRNHKGAPVKKLRAKERRKLDLKGLLPLVFLLPPHRLQSVCPFAAGRSIVVNVQGHSGSVWASWGPNDRSNSRG
jgi:hypothetical protein